MVDKNYKAEENSLLQEFAIELSKFLKQIKKDSIYVEDAKTSKFNSILQIRSNDWDNFSRMTNIDIHYEFQGSNDCLKIHLDVEDIQNLIDVKKRHDLYKKLQESLSNNSFLEENFGILLQKRLNDKYKCNQLCKFSKIIIDKNKSQEICKNILTLNEKILPIFNSVLKDFYVS